MYLGGFPAAISRFVLEGGGDLLTCCLRCTGDVGMAAAETQHIARVSIRLYGRAASDVYGMENGSDLYGMYIPSVACMGHSGG